jgi:hypothetical protein
LIAIPAANAPGDIIGHSIVLVGKFEPISAQPARLVRSGLLDQTDLGSLEYEIVMKELVFAKLPWMQLIIEQDKLTAISTLETPAGEPIRDFVLDFTELTPGKRFTALGINRDAHIALHSSEAYQNLFDRLIGLLSKNPLGLPDDALKDFPTRPEDFSLHGSLIRPALRACTVQGERDDGMNGRVIVRIEPSTRLLPGIYVQVNDHFDANPETLDDEPDQLLEQLTEGWPVSMRRADRIIEAVRDELHAIA